MKKDFKALFSNFQLVNFLKTESKKVLLMLGKDAFSVVLILIILEIIFAEFLFYKYVLAVEIVDLTAADTSVTFQKNVYESVLQEWQAREDFLKNRSQDKLSDPFK